MYMKGIIPTAIESIKWQDYRGSNSGMIVYYNTDPISEIPIREVPEEFPTEILPEPNYETKTFGLYGCKHAKMRSSFAKKKIRYLFFMTRYAGTNIDRIDELMVTGFYHIKQIADVQKLHIRYLQEYVCLNEDSCIAFLADKVHFVSVEDAFMITPEVLETWGCSSRITRQSKIALDEEKTAELAAYLESKKNVVDDYSEETERLQPAYEEEEEEEEDIEDLLEDAEDFEEEEDEVEVEDEQIVAEEVAPSEEAVEGPVEESISTNVSEMPRQEIDLDTQENSTEEAAEDKKEENDKEDAEEDNPYNLDLSKYGQ